MTFLINFPSYTQVTAAVRDWTGNSAAYIGLRERQLMQPLERAIMY